jgi:4-hydroxybenzoate polyprenyltransferase
MSKLKAYIYLMRLHKPQPILILLWPPFWALWMASESMPPFKLSVIFFLGAILVRTAGCIFNDIADRDFDGAVERTKTRPLATGAISLRAALSLAIMLCLVAFLLVLCLNVLTIFLAILGVILTIFYPLFKRFFFMPQLILGITFNFGILMGFTAVLGYLPWEGWVLYWAAVAWTLAYDTQYGMADLPYDQKLGLKSAPVFLGQWVIPAIIAFQAIMLILLTWLAIVHDYNGFFYMALVLTGLLFYQQYLYYRTFEISKCIASFTSNHWVGLLILIGFILQY